ncbi:MAG: type II CAAX endopeptidase family protein, partial [Candidatus Poseidoniaceae archaeon]|nr:type II CAAX endopeptidase family protein [Candidatus Poseidoniaceae archaeon]
MEHETVDDSVATLGRSTALLGLCLVAAAPTVSIITGFVFKAGLLAVLVFCITKVWMFGLPVFWHMKIEGKPFSWSPPKNGGWGVSFALGVGMMIVVIGAYLLLLGEIMIDKQTLYELLEPVGLTTASQLAGAILFWVFVNSVLEEYVFRWFITSKIEQLTGAKWTAVFLSAGVFTLHHTIALMMFISPLGTFIASLGVFIGGAIFSWIYLQYRSIWVAWIAHACADVAVFGIAWHLVIG